MLMKLPTLTRKQIAGVLLCAAILISVALCTALFSHQIENVFKHQSVNHTITRTKNGWEPSTITITEGDSITFKSDLGDPFWPASNVHPTHTIYPEFDPKTRIFPPDSWTFTFLKVGQWKFHDHLAPNFQGVITVLPLRGGAANTAQTDCEQLTGNEQIQCWDTSLQNILSGQGVSAAFDYFVSLYDTHPEVSRVCHGWAHSLGEADYLLYKEGKDIELRPEATFCSYGYFHGFISAMVNDSQSIDGAIAFCDAAVKKVGDQLKGLRGNCVHGVGHGITGIVEEEPQNWASFIRMAHEGIPICERLYSDPKDQSACVDGMYHELHLDILNSEYGMSFDDFKDHDLFYYCSLIAKEPHEESCYYDFITLWPFFFGQDEEAAMRYFVNKMPHLEAYAPRVLNTFARSFIELDIARGNFEHAVAACRLLPSDLRDACMDGLANGFVEHGEPNKQYIAGFAFCRSDLLTAPERNSCFTHMADELWWSYDPKLFSMACSTLAPEEKKSGCLNPNAAY